MISKEIVPVRKYILNGTPLFRGSLSLGLSTEASFGHFSKTKSSTGRDYGICPPAPMSMPIFHRHFTSVSLGWITRPRPGMMPSMQDYNFQLGCSSFAFQWEYLPILGVIPSDMFRFLLNHQAVAFAKSTEQVWFLVVVYQPETKTVSSCICGWAVIPVSFPHEWADCHHHNAAKSYWSACRIRHPISIGLENRNPFNFSCSQIQLRRTYAIVWNETFFSESMLVGSAKDSEPQLSRNRWENSLYHRKTGVLYLYHHYQSETMTTEPEFAFRVWKS